MRKPCVRQVPAIELRWHFGNPDPYATLHGAWVSVDPFAGYSHDVELAQRLFDHAAEFWPMPHDVFVFLLDREFISRTNAITYANRWVSGKSGKSCAEREDLIVASGKRIPPHPALTRYLAFHEYGHCVEHWLEWMLFPAEKQESKEDILIKQYAALRGLPENMIDAYGGNWHDAVTEVFACDFRFHVGVELEYWPHPGIPKPDEMPEVSQWWYRMREQWCAFVVEIDK